MGLIGVDRGVEMQRRCCSECGRAYEEKLPAGVAVVGDVFNIDGYQFRLGPMPAAILRSLFRTYGKPVDREALYFKVYGLDVERSPGLLNVHLVKIRRALAPTRFYIHAEWGAGVAIKEKETFAS